MADNNTNFQHFKERVQAFIEERDWQRGHNPKNIAMSISIEAAELMEIFQWCTTEDSWKINETKEAEHVREELADVLIYSISLANQLGIDISEAIEDKMRKNAVRYPAPERVGR